MESNTEANKNQAEQLQKAPARPYGYDLHNGTDHPVMQIRRFNVGQKPSRRKDEQPLKRYCNNDTICRL
jgi:hypothetical protein